MPCESRYTNIRQTQAERDAEIAAVVEAVTAALAAQRVELRIGQEGAAALNWLAGEALDMRGVTDGCVLLRLMNDNSMAFQEALAMAELQSSPSHGRARNPESPGGNMAKWTIPEALQWARDHDDDDELDPDDLRSAWTALYGRAPDNKDGPLWDDVCLALGLADTWYVVDDDGDAITVQVDAPSAEDAAEQYAQDCGHPGTYRIRVAPARGQAMSPGMWRHIPGQRVVIVEIEGACRMPGCDGRTTADDGICDECAGICDECAAASLGCV